MANEKSREEWLREIEALESKVANNPDDYRAIWELAAAYGKVKEYNLQIPQYKKIYKNYLSRYPQTSQAIICNNYAAALEKSSVKGLHRLIKLYKQAFELDPDDFIICSNLARTYENAKHWRDALDCYENASQIKPDNFNCLHKQFEINLHLGSVRNTPKDQKSMYLKRAMDILSELYTDERFNKHFSSKYPDEYFFISKAIKISQVDDNHALVYEFLSEIYQSVNNIKQRLKYKEIKDTDIAHYTKIETLGFLVKEDAKFRISNTEYLNDPTEGTVFMENIENLWDGEVLKKFPSYISYKQKDSNLPVSNTYIASFSTQTDYLPMWVQYGNDAKGCSIIFSSDMFDQKESFLPQSILRQEDDTAKLVNTSLNDTYCLYKLEYIDDEHKMDKVIEDAIKNIGVILKKCLLELSGEEEYQPVFDFTSTLLEQVRYLLKSSSYRHEDELRVIVVCEPQDAKCTDGEFTNEQTPKLYVEMNKEINIEKVILGAKVNRPNEYVPYLIKTGKVKSVHRSVINYK